MAVGFAGLGYAAQRALMMAKRVAPTDEAASVEAAKVEGVLGKIVDTPLITEPCSSDSEASSEDPKNTKALNGQAGVGQNGHSALNSDPADRHRQLEVRMCSLQLSIPCTATSGQLWSFANCEPCTMLRQDQTLQQALFAKWVGASSVRKVKQG